MDIFHKINKYGHCLTPPTNANPKLSKMLWWQNPSFPHPNGTHLLNSFHARGSEANRRSNPTVHLTIQRLGFSRSNQPDAPRPLSIPRQNPPPLPAPHPRPLSPSLLAQPPLYFFTDDFRFRFGNGNFTSGFLWLFFLKFPGIYFVRVV